MISYLFRDWSYYFAYRMQPQPVYKWFLSIWWKMLWSQIRPLVMAIRRWLSLSNFSDNFLYKALTTHFRDMETYSSRVSCAPSSWKYYKRIFNLNVFSYCGKLTKSNLFMPANTQSMILLSSRLTCTFQKRYPKRLWPIFYYVAPFRLLTAPPA